MGILDWLRTPVTAPPRDGSSPATAIVVSAVREEYAWIRQHYPGWHIGVQRCDEIDGRSYDIITLRSDHGGEHEVYFDISSFMPPSPPSGGPEKIRPIPARPGVPDRTTLFPLQDAYEYLAKLRPGIERDGQTLRWQDYSGITELRVEQIEHRTHDGLVVRELVTLTHSVAGLRATPTFAAQVNRWAALSALIPGTQGDEPDRFVCKVGVFEGDRAAAERVYAPLLCTEAAILGWHAERLLGGPLEMDPDLSPLTQVREPVPYDAADFEAAKAITDRLSAFGTLGDSGLTVEFPWDDGAVSRMFALPDLRAKLLADGEHTEEQLDRMAGPTSLLQIVTDQPHSLYGNGVLLRLELPVPFDEHTGPALVDELNRWEMSGIDLPPMFGAWCLGPRAPTFVTFLPNQYCVGLPGLLQNLAVWAHGRHVRARHWLQAALTPN